VTDRRVVSVLPSATEIVCAVGRREQLVGRSAECDYPASVRSLPVVMQPRAWDADRPSAEIDRRVRASREREESLYVLDIPRLQELRPDVLLTQDLCGVCSVTDAEVRAACALAGVAPQVVSVSPRRLSDVWDSVETIGRAIGAEREAAELAADLRRRAPPGADARPAPRVAVVEWLDPPILAGLWASELVAAGGGSSIGPAPSAPGARTTWAEIRAAAPDLVILSPCSFSVSRTLRELEDPRLAREIRTLGTSYGVQVADEAYFSRPGPRLADGADLVRHLLRRERWEPPMPVELYSPEPGRAAT
jgi:iron complex transport system substrate-binding protein